MKVSYSYSQIWKVAYPILLTLLVQNLIQVIDTAFLGRVGEVELGASAIAGIYYVVIFMLAFGFGIGSQILIGRRNGERNYHQIGDIVVYGILFLLAMALCLFLLTRLMSENVLSAMLSSPDVLDAALKYLDVRIYGIFFSVINVMFRSFYVGTTKTRVLSLNALIMALMNVFFDYTLIFGNWGFPSMGIAGAALASVIAEASAVIFLILYTCCAVNLKKYGFKNIRLTNWRVIKNVLNVSLSLMLQYFLSLGTWLFFFLAIERMGEQPLAISNIVRSVYMLLAMPVMALAATTNTLVSNTIGAGKQKEVLPLIWKVVRLSLGIVGSFVMLIALFPRLMLSVYTPDADLITMSLPSLYVVLMVLPIVAIGNIFFNSVSGTGNTRKALLIEIITLLMYIGYMWLVIVFFKAPLAVCWTTEFVYAGFIFLLSYLYLRYGKWTQRKI